MWMLKAYIVVLLVLILVEDLRHRAVHWSLFVQLAVCLVVQGELLVREKVFLGDSLFNLGFVAVQVALVTLYFSLRERRWVNILRDRIGPGDVLFLAICTLAFSRYNFMLFVVSGLVFSLVAYGLIILLFRKTKRTVPTAGLLAAYLAMWMGLELSGTVGPLYSSIPMIAL